MTIRSGFFNSKNGDRKYNARDISKYFDKLVSSGVFPNPSTQLQVVATTGMTLNVLPGRGLIDCQWIDNDANHILTVDQSDVVLNRIDAVVMKCDLTEDVRSITIEMKKGTLSTQPVAPAMTRNEYVQEYCLATVYVGKLVNEITQSNITDTRPDTRVCGWVTGLIEQVDTSTLFAQWQDAYTRFYDESNKEFDEWFQHLKQTVSTATLIRRFTSVYTTTQPDETAIPIQIEIYNQELDILNVFINGLKLIAGIEYTIDEKGKGITLTLPVEKGTPVAFEVLKSVDGSNAETLVAIVEALTEQVKNIETALSEHKNMDVYGENGVHGLRYFDERLQVKQDSGEWVDIGSGESKSYKKMTAIIDLANSNPATCVTYADDAVGMAAGDPAWDEFFGHYPVLLKNGVEVGKLNPNNFDQFEDGSSADISSGNAGDTMIAFPRRGLTITTSGTKITISMTDDPDNGDFEYNAHTRGTTAKDVFYLGVYKGYEDDGKLRSLKGKTITANQTISTFRTKAQENGSGYEQSGFYQLIFRQCMYILKYKNLNSQETIGHGYVLSSHTAAAATGGTETWGMDCEEIKKTNPDYMTDQDHHVKCFGIEDFWGNIWEWIDGLVTDLDYHILTANSGFNDDGSGYTDNGGEAPDGMGYMSKAVGSTKAGFIIKKVGGSETTFFCDGAAVVSRCLPAFGGYWKAGSQAGVFDLSVQGFSSTSANSTAARLMYL